MGLKDNRKRLERYLSDTAEAPVTVTAFEKLSGGAIQENRALTVTIRGGEFDGTHSLVLRAEAAATIAESRPLDQQFGLLKAAEAAGVTVPRALWYCGDAGVGCWRRRP